MRAFLGAHPAGSFQLPNFVPDKIVRIKDFTNRNHVNPVNPVNSILGIFRFVYMLCRL